MAEWKVELWDAIDRYVEICGGNPSECKSSDPRTDAFAAVAAVEAVIEKRINDLKASVASRVEKIMHTLNEQGRALSYGRKSPFREGK